MEKEIINLESVPKIGIIDCLVEGLTAIFENFNHFFKMLLPVVYLTVGTVLFALATFLGIFTISFGYANFYLLVPLSALGVTIIVFGAVVFCWAFWEFLLGFIAVSYLAKDIYEHKPVQKVSEYYSYVRNYSKEYIKFWLVNALVTLVWIVFFILPSAYIILKWQTLNMGTIITLICFTILYIIFTLPLACGLSLSKFFFAYQDKSKPYQIIKNAILITYKNFFPIFGFLFLLNIVIFMLETVLGCLCPPLGFILSLIAAYFEIFVTTRYYFEIIKY